MNLTAELPGVEEKDVDVTLADCVLTIRGDKKSERDEQDKDKRWHVVERSYGSFSRTISLPFNTDRRSRQRLIKACGKFTCRSL